jgi:hypothetical protein
MAHPNLISNKRSIAISLLVNLGLTAILLAGLYFLPLPQLLPCTDPLVENLILASFIALIIQFLVFKIFSMGATFWIASMDLGLILLALWLGIYPISPLGYSSGRTPIAQGFVLTRSMRPDAKIASGETINVIGNSAIAIRVVTLPISKNCVWFSTKGGSLDDPMSCDIDYMPPKDSDFDFLKVLIQPSCHLPETQENIKIIVLP